MATSKVFIWVTLCTCVVFASPTRRQFNSNTETTSSDPVIVVTDDGTSWDDSDDDFDLEGGGWMKEVSASPSSIPESPDYEDYDDEDDDDVVQPVDKDESSNNSEFLFLQPTDTRLMLEDDDDNQPGIIKVRHTSKNSYSEAQDGGNALETIEKSNSDDQFVFTIDGDDDDDFDGSNNKLDSNKDDDFVLEDSAEQPKKTSKKEDSSSRREDDDDDGDGDDSDDDDLADNEDDSVFDSPDDDAQVIYGDHVFLY